MRLIVYALIRAMLALLIGLVLIFWPGAIGYYIIIAIGLGFFIPGIISVICFIYSRASSSGHGFPIEGVASLLFGLWIIIMPSFFIDIFLFLLGFALVM